MMPSQPSAKLSKHGRLAKAHEHHITVRISRRVVDRARHEADKVVYDIINHKSSDIFCIANQMRKENVDVVGDNPVKNDAEGNVNERGGKAECVG